jgi:hypothetical protein
MSIIARSEAIQRLHIIISNARSAMEAVRADEWEESVLRAEMALDQLQKLTPWLEDASNNAPARPNVAAQEHIGGMGYRGSTGGRKSAGDSFSISGMPETIPMPNRMPPTPLPDRDPTPPRPIQPRPAPAQHRVIVTPPPPLPPPPPEVEVTFDLTRMPGQVPYQVECENGTAAPLTDTELQISARFVQLPTRLQDKIKLKYVETGKPVTVRLRQGERNG